MKKRKNECNVNEGHLERDAKFKHAKNLCDESNNFLKNTGYCDREFFHKHTPFYHAFIYTRFVTFRYFWVWWTKKGETIDPYIL